MSRAAVLLVVLTAAGTRALGTDLVFPGGEKGVRLRVEVADGADPPEAVWASFLNDLHKYFDRDGDGALSAAEAKRVFPLPLADGKTVSPDFAALDADRNDKVTPQEFRAYYRAKGFAPVTVRVVAAPPEVRALGGALFAHLDRDGDGTLSATELRAAPKLLDRLDEDEDEVLTAAEVLGLDPKTRGTPPAGVKLGDATHAPDTTLRLTLSGKPELNGPARGIELSAGGARLRFPGGRCALEPAKHDPVVGFRAAKGFYFAQFKAAGGKAVPKSVFDDDPGAQVLAGLFDAADRDGDGKLTLTELDAFFALVERGVGCSATVTVTDRGRNLFDVFDRNGDGRLDLGELLAGRARPDGLPDGPITREAVPGAYRLTLARGTTAAAFGPVPFGTASARVPAPAAARRGPEWFRALDRNGDGFVSAREFVGPPELFAKLDTNGDGRISAEEAAVARP